MIDDINTALSSLSKEDQDICLAIIKAYIMADTRGRETLAHFAYIMLASECRE